jgi:hypothetical protein
MESNRETMKIYNVQAEFQGTYGWPLEPIVYLVVHHAAGLYPTYNGIEDVRSVAKFHTDPPPNGRGWPGIAYDVCLAELNEGREIARYNVSDQTKQRAGAFDHNHHAIHVCALTNFDTHPNRLPAQKWVDALAVTLQDLKRRYPQAIIIGHKELSNNATTCPGSRWAAWKPGLLARVQGHTPTPPPVPIPVHTKLAVYRAKVGLNVRARPSLHAPILRSLPANTPVSIDWRMRDAQGQLIGGSPDWLHVYEGGYIHSTLLRLERPGKRLVVRNGSRLRAYPSTAGLVLDELPAGTPIDIDWSTLDGQPIHGSKEWLHLYQGGYIHSSLVEPA